MGMGHLFAAGVTCMEFCNQETTPDSAPSPLQGRDTQGRLELHWASLQPEQRPSLGHLSEVPGVQVGVGRELFRPFTAPPMQVIRAEFHLLHNRADSISPVRGHFQAVPRVACLPTWAMGHTEVFFSTEVCRRMNFGVVVYLSGSPSGEMGLPLTSSYGLP